MTENKPLIGFIGQGFIGKNYADDLENRGHSVVRYSRDPEYSTNKEKIKDCDIVFIAVPTPTTTEGYDDSILREVVPLAGAGKIVVIKSTILPGLTRVFQKDFADKIIIHSPEFLSEATAKEDAENPFMNIMGIDMDSSHHIESAKLVHSVLPNSPYSSTVSYEEAELIKYTHNNMAYTQIIFFNLMYNLASKLGAEWKNIADAINADPTIGSRYSSPIHKSGRGAGGHCFIKDFSAMRNVYEKIANDPAGLEVLKSLEKKNIELLKESKKDLDLLQGVYGNN